MSESILTSTKKSLGLTDTYTAFDPDIIMYINSALASLNQIGVGPGEGFSITDDTAVWTDFIGTDVRYNPVKTYVYLRTRLLFDPPTTSYLIDAMKDEITRHEWSLSVLREGAAWVDPSPTTLTEDIYDGGQP